MRKILLTAQCLCVVHYGLHAQDSLKSTTLNEVVVSGTRFEVPVEKSGKIVFKISEQEPGQGSGRSVADVLNQVPGIQMDGNFSAPGANLSYYVRGGRNRHSLIRLDGVPLIDPSGIEQFFDLRFLAMDQLESIEVLQGSLSTLYGSGAAGGVLSLQTKRNTENGIHGSLLAGTGSWNTFNQSINLNGKFNKTSFTVMGNNYSSEGFSAAQDNDPAVEFDKDGLDKRNLFVHVDHDFTSAFSLRGFASYDWLDNEFDTWTFTDGNESQVYSQFRFGVKGTYRYAKGTLDVVMQKSETDREEKTTYPATYEGVTAYGEVINRHQLSSGITAVSGVTLQKLSYSEAQVNEHDTTSFTIVDPYTSLFLDLPNGLTIHAGVRLNTHSVYGNQLLYNFNPSWLIRINTNFKIKLLASASTAYITPSLFQLYTTWGGNKNLKPEEDFNVEFGATFYWKDKLQFTAVNYYRTETSSITYSPAFEYVNTDRNRYVDGTTIDATWRVVKQLKVNADYAYTHTNLSNTFYRIPAHKAGAAVTYQPLPNSSIYFRYLFTGRRTDLSFPDEIELDSYSLVDITLSHNFLKDKFTAYFTAANLFDEQFVAIYGYTTRGRNFTTGLKFSF